MTPDPIATALENLPEARSTAGMTTKVVRGSLWTLAGQVAPLCVSLVATPFVIRFLGAEGYGVLILVALIPTYLGFADFGMSIASTKFASEAYAEGSLQKEARLVRTAAVIALLSSMPVALVLFAFSGQLIELFNVPEQLRLDSALALKFASVTFVVGFLNGIFNTPQLTRLRMDLNTLVTATFRILGLIAVPIVLYRGGGISGAVFVLMAASLLTLLGHLYTSNRLVGHLFEFTINRRAALPMLKFGTNLTIAAIAGVLLVNAEKLILTRLVSVKALAFYSVAFALTTMAMLFSTAMIQSLIPAFSQLLVSDRDAFQVLFSRAIRINIIVILPLLMILFVLARPFFTIWAGAEFGNESTVPFYILLIGMLFNLSAYIPFCCIMASGRTDIFAKLYWIQLAIYIFVAVLLVDLFGIVGAAIAWSVRVIGDAFILFYLSKKVVRVSYGRTRPFSLTVSALFLLPPIPFVIFSESFAISLVFVVPLSLLLYALFVWNRIAEEPERLWIIAHLRTIPLLSKAFSDR